MIGWSMLASVSGVIWPRSQATRLWEGGAAARCRGDLQAKFAGAGAHTMRLS